MVKTELAMHKKKVGVRKARTTNVDVVIGRRLQNLREKLNITQADLGDAVGVTFQQVQKYEKGVNRIHAETIWRMAHKYDINIDDFFAGISENSDEELPVVSHVSIPDIKHGDKQSLKFAGAYLAIKDHKLRRKIFGLIESLVN